MPNQKTQVVTCWKKHLCKKRGKNVQDFLYLEKSIVESNKVTLQKTLAWKFWSKIFSVNGVARRSSAHEVANDATEINDVSWNILVGIWVLWCAHGIPRTTRTLSKEKIADLQYWVPPRGWWSSLFSTHGVRTSVYHNYGKTLKKSAVHGCHGAGKGKNSGGEAPQVEPDRRCNVHLSLHIYERDMRFDPIEVRSATTLSPSF